MYITGFAIFQYILIFGVIIATVFLEGVLVKRKKKKTTLVLILLVFVLMTLSSISLANITSSTSSRAGVVIWSNENNSRAIGELEILHDDNSNNVIGFGMLKLDSGETPEYLKLVYNDVGELIGEENALKYADAISTSLNDTPWKKLSGTSMSLDELNKLDQVTNNENTNFEINVFIKAFFISNIWTAVLVIVNVVFTYRINRQKKKNVDSIKIQDL